jgi:hypothetical protein
MKSRDNFVAFVRIRMRNRRDPIGDLARELSSDPKAPFRGGPKTLRDYLNARGASDQAHAALESAAEVWKVLR